MSNAAGTVVDSNGTMVNPMYPTAKTVTTTIKPYVPPTTPSPTTPPIPLSFSSGSQQTSQYVFTQSTPLSNWVITHNLNRYPVVVVIDSTDTQVVGDVVYNSQNQVTLLFGGGFSGTAILT